MPTEKKCSECQTIKPLGDFRKSTNSPDGHSYYCRPCDNERIKRWRKDKKERERGLTTEEAAALIKKLDSGEFAVTQDWLLKELLVLYKDPTNRDRLGTLKMIAQISGYNKDDTDEKAIINSLMQSMKNGTTGV